jgi:hypothetical protein
MPTTAPNATNTAMFLTEIPDAVRTVATDLSARLNVRESSFETRMGKELTVGESLPETVELHSIPNHETYRYAVVDDHRFVVDAMSRKVVYVIR